MIRRALLLAAFAVLLVPATAAADADTQINFEGLTAGQRIDTTYTAADGVTFGTPQGFGVADNSDQCAAPTATTATGGMNGTQSAEISCRSSNAEIAERYLGTAMEFNDERQRVSFDLEQTIVPATAATVTFYGTSGSALSSQTVTLAEGAVVPVSYDHGQASGGIADVVIKDDIGYDDGGAAWLDNIDATLDTTSLTKEFSLALPTPSVDGVEGSSATAAVSVRRFNGSTGAVTLSAGALPPGVQAVQFSPNPVNGIEPSTMTFTLDRPLTGQRQITVNASGSASAGTQVGATKVQTVNVTPAFTFPENPEPLTLVPGCGPQTVTEDVNVGGGYVGGAPVSVDTVTGGLSVQVQPGSTLLGVDGNGTYPITLQLGVGNSPGGGTFALHVDPQDATAATETLRWGTDSVSIDRVVDTDASYGGTVDVEGNFPVECTLTFTDAAGHTWPVVKRSIGTAPNGSYDDDLTLRVPSTAVSGPLTVTSPTGFVYGHTASFNVSAQSELRVNAMEITQGVQTFELPTRNPANPLDDTVNYHGVAVPDSGSKSVIVKMADDNHPTVIRVYANTSAPLPGGVVPTMVLHAFRGGNEVYPSPITPDISSLTFTRAQPADLPVGGVAQVPANAQTTPDAAYTFTLPSSWTSGDVTFEAEIDPAGFTPTVPLCASCRKYSILRLGPIHFTRINSVYVQPVPLADGSNYPLGSPNQDPYYIPQAQGEASTDPISTGGLGTSRPTPFAGMRAVTPFTYHIFPSYHVVDASSVYNDNTLSYATESAKLAQLVNQWAVQVGSGAHYGLNYGHNATYFAGVIPSQATGYSGGLTLGNALLYGKGNTPVGAWSDDRPVNAAAHEFGHTIGRVHAGLNCGSNGNGQVGEAWAPNNDGDFWGVGLDMTAPSPYRILSWNESSSPTDSAVKSPPGAFYDLMSYCGSVTGSQDHWVSVMNWNRAVDFGAANVGHGQPSGPERDVARARTAAVSQSLSVTASYDILANHAQVIDVHPTAGGPTAASASSTYSMRALDASGHPISQNAVSASLSYIEPSPRVQQLASPIEITGLIPAGAQAVQVLQSGQVIAQRTASAHAPTVRVISPRRGQRVGAGGHAVIRWKAADADGDALMASVEYSPDGGRTWASIYEGPADPGRVVLPSMLLGHSTRARVRVDVNDGWHQISATSPVFRSLGAPPTVMLTAPAFKARVAAGGNLNLAATAYDDHQRPLTGKAIRWTAGRFLVGTGDNLSADDLPAGHYRLTATATDSSGRKGSASVPIVVLPAKPLLRVLKAPRTISPRAQSVKIRVAAVTPVILRVGRHQSLVTRTPSTVTVSITPGRTPLSIRVILRSGPNVVRLTVKIRRR
jgi:hypothetical protein